MTAKFDRLSKENREFYDNFHKKVRAKRNYFKEYDYFIATIGSPDNKVILSVGNGDKEPFFKNAIISDISIEALRKVNVSQRCVFDVHFMPFKPKSIDIVYGWQVVHHFDIDKFLPELKIALRDSGKAVFVDNGYGPQWRMVRKWFPKKKAEPDEDLKEEFLQSKAESYGFKNFRSKRFNFFSYLFSKAMREIGISAAAGFLMHIDDFFSRWGFFRRNLRNIVWSFENKII